MKKDKLFEFEIERPLTAAKRKVVEKLISQHSEQADKPVAWHWDEDDDQILHIAIDPAEIEIRFEELIVALYIGLPFWARALFTESRKNELRQLVEDILEKAKFVSVQKA
jgi:hypothetical protein